MGALAAGSGARLLRRFSSPAALQYVRRGELEQELGRLKDSAISRQLLEGHFARLAALVTEQHAQTQGQLAAAQLALAELEQETQSLKKMMAHVTAGLGLKFERFNRAWLEHFLRSKGVVGGLAGIQQGRIEPRVGALRNVEIDLFCLDPPLIVECTSFIDRDELPKIERFAAVRRALSSRHRVELRGYVAALAVHQRIQRRVVDACRHHDLVLITQF